MRRVLASLAIATSLTGPAPVEAMDLSEAAVRLVTIDSELTECLQARILGAVIVVRALRACIADKRPDEKALRKDLNDWISTLAGDDADRPKALAIRQALNRLRAFMNQLEARLKEMPDEIGPGDFETAARPACVDSGMAGHRAETTADSTPRTGTGENAAGQEVCLPRMSCATGDTENVNDYVVGDVALSQNTVRYAICR